MKDLVNNIKDGLKLAGVLGGSLILIVASYALFNENWNNVSLSILLISFLLQILIF